MAFTRGKLILFNIMQWILIIVFTIEGVTKLLGIQFQVDNFIRWGYPTWFRLAVGAFELIGVIVLMTDHRRWAVAWLTALMLGAIYTHVTHGEFQQIGLAVLMLVLLRVSDRLKWQGRLEAGML